MQLCNITFDLFELLVLNIIESLLHALKILLVLLIGVFDEVVHGRKLRVLFPSDNSWNLELFCKRVEDSFYPIQICLIFQSNQGELLIQGIFHMFLNLLACHHTSVHFECDVVDLLAELVVEIIGGVSVAPAHCL